MNVLRSFHAFAGRLTRVKAPVRHALGRALWCATGLLAVGPLLAAQAPAPQAQAASPRFDIWEYQIEGNLDLPVPVIEAAVSPHLGPGKDMQAVEAARAALEAAYQRAGRLTAWVDVPEQRVDEGIVRLSVQAGRVGALYVTGSRYHDQGHIRAAVPALAVGQVPDFNQVQAQLDGLNRSEVRRLQPVLKPGNQPGTVDVELQVADQNPWSGSLALNNHHSRDTDPLRLQLSLRHANVLQRDHQWSLTVQTAPTEPQQTGLVQTSYTVPEADGQWVFSFSHSGSDLQTLGGAQVLGQGNTWGLRRQWSVGGSGFLSAGADLKWLQEHTRFGEGQISTPLRYLPFQLAYSDQWPLWAGQLQWTATGVWALGALLSHTVSCPGADGSDTQVDQFACKRQGADGSFALLRLDGRWARPLPWGSLLARVGTQFAVQPLVSAEQFSLGGADTVRGYLEGEASGDHGWFGGVEWRSPNTATWLGQAWQESSLLLFAEAGRTHWLQPSAGQAGRVPLASVGAGWRGQWALPGTEGMDAALDLAWPLRGTATSPRGEWRLHARIQARF